MSVNLIDMAKGLFANEVASKAASALNESESNVSRAFSGIIPAVFQGLIDKTRTTDGAESIARLAQEQSSNGLFDNLGSLLGGADNSSWFSKGSSLVSSLFGNKVDGLVNLISNFAGIRSSSSSSLLSLAVPAILGMLGKHMRTNNMNASGLTSLLNDQKSNISALIPAGLGLSSLFGGSDHTTHTTHTTTTHATANTTRPAAATHTTSYEEDNRGGGMKWLWPLLLLVLLGALSLYLWRSCNDKKVVPTSDTTTTVTTRDTNIVAPATTTTTVTKVDEDIDLNGIKLKGYRGGMEDNMITYLKGGTYKDATDESLKSTWYNFDHVNFKMGSSTELEAGSQGQLENLAAILKAYPDAKIKIGGYTDKTGNEEGNKKLSQARADFIKNWLGKQGLGGQVLGAEGYGSQFATVDAAASDAERAVDRKMAVRFAK